MKVQIYYTEQGVECVDTISIPENATHRPEIGAVLMKFHGKKQLARRYSNEIVDGTRVRSYWYERSLMPEDYHVHKVVSCGTRDGLLNIAGGRFTYEFGESVKTPNMWKEDLQQTVEQAEMNL